MVQTRKSLKQKKENEKKLLRNMTICEDSESDEELIRKPPAKKNKTIKKKKKTSRSTTKSESKNKVLNKKNGLGKKKDTARKANKSENKKTPTENSLDMALICDCTGSMSAWMTRAKETLNAIIKNVQEAHKGLHIRVAFVGYRDFCDGPQQFAILPFTDDISAVKSFINAQPATGGGDMPEDAVGAFIKVNELIWQAKTRVAFFICDAPAHGRQYHNEADLYDTKPNGHPSGTTLEQTMHQLIQLQVHLTCIKLTKHTDKMFEVMAKSYNNDKFTMELTDMDQTKLKGVSKEDIDKFFIDSATKFIISKKDNEGRSTVEQVPRWEGKIEVDQWFSSTNYLKVISIMGNKADVTSTAGGNWTVTGLELLHRMDSADHFDYEIPLNKGELVEMLESTRDTIFTICFKKKIKPKNVSSRIIEEARDVSGDLKKSKKLTKLLLEGESCTLTACLVNVEPRLGRSMVRDLSKPAGKDLRQVDHRTIEWIIFKNRKFILKKSGKKYPVLPEAALDIENPINIKWNVDKLSVGNWLSDTKYIKIVKILPNNFLEVTSTEGVNLNISASIVQNEMNSATHYNNTEKIPRTQLASILEDAGNTVFSATFYTKVKENDVADQICNLDLEILDNKRKLNKFVNQILTGKQSTISGYLAKSYPKLGRSMVKKLAVKSKFNIRQIDHRTLESIIYNNTLYQVK